MTLALVLLAGACDGRLVSGPSQGLTNTDMGRPEDDQTLLPALDAGAAEAQRSDRQSASTDQPLADHRRADQRLPDRLVLKPDTLTATGPQPPYGKTVGVTASNFTVADCSGLSFNLYDRYTKYPAVVIAYGWVGFT